MRPHEEAIFDLARLDNKIRRANGTGRGVTLTAEQVTTILELPGMRERLASAVQEAIAALPRVPDLPRPDEQDANRSVYFVRASSGHIKIGCAFDPMYRMADMQVAHPLPLELLATVPGGVVTESYLHRFYEHEWVRGEWFEPSERLLQFVQSVGGEQ